MKATNLEPSQKHFLQHGVLCQSSQNVTGPFCSVLVPTNVNTLLSVRSRGKTGRNNGTLEFSIKQKKKKPKTFSTNLMIDDGSSSKAETSLQLFCPISVRAICQLSYETTQKRRNLLPCLEHFERLGSRSPNKQICRRARRPELVS